MGQEFLSVVAPGADPNGAGIEEVLTRLTGVGERTRLFAVLSTLKYLAMFLVGGGLTLFSPAPAIWVWQVNRQTG
jgi:fatty acid-binding protein DegV